METPPGAVAGNIGRVRERFRVGWRGYPNVLRSHYNSDKVMTSRERLEKSCRETTSCF